MDGRTTGAGPWLSYKLTFEPLAQVSKNGRVHIRSAGAGANNPLGLIFFKIQKRKSSVNLSFAASLSL